MAFKARAARASWASDRWRSVYEVGSGFYLLVIGPDRCYLHKASASNPQRVKLMPKGPRNDMPVIEVVHSGLLDYSEFLNRRL